ncbi:MAG: PDZ domain-containing protein [Thermoleophilia bacterium]|nr:PDZ domain-containing protein [Thermoleophilia bacterium]
MRRFLFYLILGFALVTLVVTGGVLLWSLQANSEDFAFVPRAAVPTIGVVSLEGQESPPKGAGSVYFSTIGVRHATLYETWFGVGDGGELIPNHALLEPGESEEDHSRLDTVAMDSSQTAAKVVGLRALGVPISVKAEGVRIVGIDPQAPIATSGAELGDLILAINDTRVTTTPQLRGALTRIGADTAITLEVRRGKETDTVSTRTISTRTIKNAQGGVILGIVPSEAMLITTPREVTFSVEGVGGPSAGLAFALQIYSAGKNYQDLRGLRVAATGTLSMEGAVGPIGGATQKAIGAGRVDADLFLVPMENVAEARQSAPSGVEVVGVATFTDALRAIAHARTS